MTSLKVVDPPQFGAAHGMDDEFVRPIAICHRSDSAAAEVVSDFCRWNFREKASGELTSGIN